MATDAPESQLLDAAPGASLALTSVEVHRLHGKFSYRIDLATSDHVPHAVDTADGLFAANEERLTLLYGNNGTGKTSLLRLLFHALSSAGNKGHRTTVLNTRFARLAVRFTDGTLIAYSRSEDQLSGPFRAEIHLAGDGTDPITWNYSADDQRASVYLEDDLARWPTEATIRSAGSITLFREDDETRFLRTLDELALNPVLLSDSRAITADVLPDNGAITRRARDRARRGLDPDDEALRERRDIDVVSALERVRTYLSQLAFAGTQAGSQRVDTVYLNVAAAIVQHASKVGRPNQTLLPSLRERCLTSANVRSAFIRTDCFQSSRLRHSTRVSLMRPAETARCWSTFLIRTSTDWRSGWTPSSQDSMPWHLLSTHSTRSLKARGRSSALVRLE